ncbi:class I SAM-dependent methyltransferase [uncultured Litoreibacter sp.]|uniref:class I SAM-dependent DNA methyltransferase n=1 Tax=uncultured Litoreibacter sp. TaxID=1392394 RepID=UPI00263756B6|nr:class I SAM-dependent methyltransferase [uncultured Litoreibacter sp.]
MSDKETLAAYAAKAESYASLVSRKTPDGDLQAFLDAMPEGGRVLDLGCGPGNSARMMRDAGLEVDASDASPEMVAIAKERYAIDARLERFDDLTAQNLYDGIWANFSLLHAPRADMPRHLSAIHTALKTGGLLHLGLKTGDIEERDEAGRFYVYYSEDELRRLLQEANFKFNSIRHGEMVGLVRGPEPFMIVTANA